MPSFSFIHSFFFFFFFSRFPFRFLGSRHIIISSLLCCSLPLILSFFYLNDLQSWYWLLLFFRSTKNGWHLILELEQAFINTLRFASENLQLVSQVRLQKISTSQFHQASWDFNYTNLSSFASRLLCNSVEVNSCLFPHLFFFFFFVIIFLYCSASI